MALRVIAPRPAARRRPAGARADPLPEARITEARARGAGRPGASRSRAPPRNWRARPASAPA